MGRCARCGHIVEGEHKCGTTQDVPDNAMSRLPRSRVNASLTIEMLDLLLEALERHLTTSPTFEGDPTVQATKTALLLARQTLLNRENQPK